MDVSTALRRARERARLNLGELGRQIGYSQQMMSAVELGHKPIAPDVARVAARLLDAPDLYMALAEETTSGVMVPALLDGPKVDLHRLATGRKLTEEAAEAIEAWARAKCLVNCRTGEDLNDEGRAEAMEFCHQTYELLTAAGNTIRVMCETYGFSARDLARRHMDELVRKGLAEPRREARRFAKTA